jgi:hypothetical protein
MSGSDGGVEAKFRSTSASFPLSLAARSLSSRSLPSTRQKQCPDVLDRIRSLLAPPSLSILPPVILMSKTKHTLVLLSKRMRCRTR